MFGLAVERAKQQQMKAMERIAEIGDLSSFNRVRRPEAYANAVMVQLVDIGGTLRPTVSLMVKDEAMQEPLAALAKQIIDAVAVKKLDAEGE